MSIAISLSHYSVYDIMVVLTLTPVITVCCCRLLDRHHSKTTVVGIPDQSPAANVTAIYDDDRLKTLPPFCVR